MEDVYLVIQLFNRDKKYRLLGIFTTLEAAEELELLDRDGEVEIKKVKLNRLYNNVIIW